MPDRHEWIEEGRRASMQKGSIERGLGMFMKFMFSVLTAVRVEAGKRNNVRSAVSFYHNKRKEEKVVKLQ